MQYKDLFSKQSSGYARFRPRYPKELFEALARLAPGTARAWDCGTGNGQAAAELAVYFDSVIATDPSPKQLEQATPDPKVRYLEGSAGHAPLEAGSCDLVTAAQAFHWFDQEAFYAEAKRVLRPGGLVAIWCYNLCEISPEVDALVHDLYEGVLGSYWEPERRQVEKGYADAAFPFEELPAPSFAMEKEWNLEHLLGYIGTWSAYQTYLKKNPGDEPLKRLAPEFEAAWGRQSQRKARWQLSMRLGR